MTSAAASQHAAWVGPHGPATASAPVESAVANLDAEIDGIDQLGIAGLREHWREIYGLEAPARLGSEFLKRALAFHLQERMLGGLSRQTRLRLKALEKKPAGVKDDRGRLSSSASVKSPFFALRLVRKSCEAWLRCPARNPLLLTTFNKTFGRPGHRLVVD